MKAAPRAFVAEERATEHGPRSRRLIKIKPPRPRFLPRQRDNRGIVVISRTLKTMSDEPPRVTLLRNVESTFFFFKLLNDIASFR